MRHLPSWIYQIAAQLGAATLPDHFADLVLRIARNKILVFAALFLMLRLDGDSVTGAQRRKGEAPRCGATIGLAMFALLNVALDSAMNSLIPRPPSSGP